MGVRYFVLVTLLLSVAETNPYLPNPRPFEPAPQFESGIEIPEFVPLEPGDSLFPVKPEIEQNEERDQENDPSSSGGQETNSNLTQCTHGIMTSVNSSFL